MAGQKKVASSALRIEGIDAAIAPARDSSASYFSSSKATTTDKSTHASKKSSGSK